MARRYPSADTVFEYYVDPKSKAWLAWETKLSGTFKPAMDQPFFRIMVPTVDTVRNRFVASALVRVSQVRPPQPPPCAATLEAPVQHLCLDGESAAARRPVARLR